MKRLFSPAVLFLLLISLTAHLTAQGTHHRFQGTGNPSIQVLYQETFDYPDGPLPAQWWSEGNPAEISEGRLFVDADQEGYRVSTVWLDHEFSGNIRIEFDVHVVSSGDTANNINCLLIYSDPAGESLRATRNLRKDGTYSRYHQLNGYIFTFLANRDPENARTRFRDNPGFNLVAEAYGHECKAGKTYHIKIEKTDRRFQYWVDDNKLLDTKDDQYNEPHNKGLFGFRTWHTALWWDNLVVSAIDPHLLPESDRATKTVASPASLSKAVADADPGDEIIIAAGMHEDWEVQLAGSGAPGRPIVIRPENSDKTVLTGATAWKINGSYLEVRNLRFRDCTMDEENIITFDDAGHCRMTRCRFENSKGTRKVIEFRGSASHNRVDHCTMFHTVGRPVQIRVDDQNLPKNNRIDHNLFEDVPPKGSNGRETIQIGQNQPAYGLLEPKTIVEYNLFLRCNGEGEIISNKSSGNIYRGNVFRECQGALVMRGGSHCQITDNWMEACSHGIRLHGTHHVVTGNTIVNSMGAGIILSYGMQRTLGSLYQATGFCLVAHNTIAGAGMQGIFLGANRDRELNNENWNYEKLGDLTVQSEAPYQNRILNNILAGTQGILLQVDGSPENKIAGNLLYATDKAQSGAVGVAAVLADPLFVAPDAQDYQLLPASPAYKTRPVNIVDMQQPSHLGSAGIRPEAGPAY